MWQSLTLIAGMERCANRVHASADVLWIAASAGNARSHFVLRRVKKKGKDAVRLWQSNKNMNLDVKSIVVAPGITDAKPPQGLHGYGIHENVITIPSV